MGWEEFFPRPVVPVSAALAKFPDETLRFSGRVT